MRPAADSSEVNTDSAAIAHAPTAGDPATVLRRGIPAGDVCVGSFVAEHAFNVSIEFEGLPSFIEPGQEVVIACGPIGKRVVLLARFRELRGTRAMFVRQSPWRPVDARLYRRYRTAISATLDAGGEPQPGRIVDISLGGAAVECEASRSVRRISLSFEGMPEQLRCRVVNQDERDGHRVLHLQFEALSDAGRAHVRHLVEALGAEVEAELLAS